MKYAQALQEAKRAVTTLGISQCPLAQKTGLIALVFGGDDDSALANVVVTVGTTRIPTDARGIAMFVPLPTGRHTVHADCPGNPTTLVAPKDESAQVDEGKCPVVPLHMPTGVTPELKVAWAHDKAAVAGVEIELVESGAPKKTTTQAGVAKWDRLLPPSRFTVTPTFPDGKHYLLFDTAGRVVNSIDLKAGASQTFEIKRQRVTFRVQRLTGGVLQEVEGATIKLKVPATQVTTALSNTQAVAELIIPVEQRDQATTWEVESLTPDASAAIYEVVEVTTT